MHWIVGVGGLAFLLGPPWEAHRYFTSNRPLEIDQFTNHQ